MRFLIAPNAFKECLSAAQVAQAIQRGLQKADPKFQITVLPLSDGGPGLLDCVSQLPNSILCKAEINLPLGSKKMRFLCAPWQQAGY